MTSPQRWTRPAAFNASPGHWKKQMPGKYLRPAARGDIDGLKALLEERPSAINERANHGRTLIWEAARGGRLEAARFLLAAGADPNLTGCFNSESHVQLSAACAARFYGRDAVFELLQPLERPLDVFRLAYMGETQALRAMCSATRGLVDEEDPEDEIYQMPIVAFAVVGEHLDLTDWLAGKMARLGQYSAMLSFLCGLADRVELFDLLLAHGLEADEIDAAAFVSCRSAQFCQHLIESGANVNRTGSGGFTPLLYCCRGDKGKKRDRIELLIAAGADVDARGPDGKTALHLAAKSPEVTALLFAAGANPDLTDAAGVRAGEAADR